MHLNFDIFNQLTDKNFKINFSKELQANAQLIEVKKLSDYSSQPQENQRISFSLLFNANIDNIFEQSSYKITHDKLGEITLFLIPIAVDENSVIYEAIFN